MTLSRAIMEERAQKEIAVQQALAQARAEMAEKMETITVVAADEKATTYSVNWAHQGAAQNSIESIIDGETAESDKEKE